MGIDFDGKVHIQRAWVTPGHTSSQLGEELPEPAGVTLVADAPLEHVFWETELLSKDVPYLGMDNVTVTVTIPRHRKRSGRQVSNRTDGI